MWLALKKTQMWESWPMFLATNILGKDLGALVEYDIMQGHAQNFVKDKFRAYVQRGDFFKAASKLWINAKRNSWSEQYWQSVRGQKFIWGLILGGLNQNLAL